MLFASLNSALAAGPRTIRLFMNRPPMYITEACKVSSGGFSPCIGFVLYHPELKEAVVGHFSSFEYLTRSKEAVELARSKWTNLNPVRAYIAGSALFDSKTSRPDKIDREASQERGDLIRYLKEEGIQDGNLNVRWLPDQMSGEFSFDIQSGEGELLISPDLFRTKAQKNIKHWNTQGGESPERCFQVVIDEIFR